MWLTTKTRFDTSFCVNVLCRFLKCATEAHYNLARGRPLRYLQGTLSTGIGDWVLSAGADADFAGDFTNSRSMMGSFIKLGDVGTVSAGCYLERKVARHFRVSQAYVRGTVDIQRVDTDKNPADLFTKPLHSLLFVRHRNSIMGADFP